MVSDLPVELRKLSADVRAVSSQSADHLNELAVFIEQPDFDKKTGIDLYGAVNPAGIEASAFAAYQNQRNWLRWIEWARNVLVLVPICFTWFGLAQASTDYARLLALDPKLIDQPFLLLWEQGFPALNEGIKIKFSQIALLDFLLLFVILSLSFIVHYYRDVHESQAAVRALELRHRTENILWQVEKLLAEKRYLQDPGVAFAQFDTSAQALVEELKRERGRLETLLAQREKEVVNLSAMGKEMTQAASNLQKFSTKVKQVYDPLEKSVTQLADNVKETDGKQLALTTAMAGVALELGRLSKASEGSSQALEFASNQVTTSSERIANYTGASAAHFEQIRVLLDDMTLRQDEITKNLRSATGDIAVVSANMQQTFAQLSDAESHLAPSLNLLISNAELLKNAIVQSDQSSQKLSAAADQITHGSQVWANSEQQLQTLTTQLNRVATNLATSLHDVGTLSQKMGDAVVLLKPFQTFPAEAEKWNKNLLAAISRLEKSTGSTNAVKRSSAEWAATWVTPGLLALIALILTISVLK